MAVNSVKGHTAGNCHSINRRGTVMLYTSCSPPFHLLLYITSMYFDITMNVDGECSIKCSPTQTGLKIVDNPQEIDGMYWSPLFEHSQYKKVWCAVQCVPCQRPFKGIPYFSPTNTRNDLFKMIERRRRRRKAVQRLDYTIPEAQEPCLKKHASFTSPPWYSLASSKRGITCLDVSHMGD